MNKNTVFSVLNNLNQRNLDATKRYRQAAGMIEDDEGLVEFLESLADYREKLQGELRQALEMLPPIPVSANVDVKSYLSAHWEDFSEVLGKGNRTKIAEFCHESEKALSNYYKENLEMKGIPPQVRELLENQHQLVLKITRKTERMDTIPQLRNNGF